MQFPWMQGLEHVPKTYNYVLENLHDHSHISNKTFINKILRENIFKNLRPI